MLTSWKASAEADAAQRIGKTQQHEVRQNKPFKPLSFKELFEDDFLYDGQMVQALAHESPMIWIGDDHVSKVIILIRERMIVDPNSNGYFMAYWVDSSRREFVVGQCKQISLHFLDNVPHYQSHFGIVRGITTDVKHIEIGKKPVFTRRVVLFVAGLSYAEKAEIEKMFAEKDVEVVIRDEAYLRERNLQLANLPEDQRILWRESS